MIFFSKTLLSKIKKDLKQSALILLCLMLSIFLSFLLLSLSQVFSTQNPQQLWTKMLEISLDDHLLTNPFKYMDKELIAKITHQKGTAQSSLVYKLTTPEVTLSSLNTTWDVNFMDLQSLAFQYALIHGRLFKKNEIMRRKPVALINETGALQYFPGKTALGQTLYINKIPFVIKGIVNLQSGNFNNTPTLILPTSFHDLLGTYTTFIDIIPYGTYKQLPALISDIKKSLKFYYHLHSVSSFFIFRDTSYFIQKNMQMTYILSYFSMTIALLSLGTSFFALNNLSNLYLEFDKQELALLKILGMKLNHIILPYLTHLIIIIFLSFFMGLILSHLVCYLINTVHADLSWFHLKTIHLNIDVIDIIFIASLIAIGSGIIFLNILKKINAYDASRILTE